MKTKFTPPGNLTYEEHHEILKRYLLAKFEIEDWHGVSDAANDLRDLESKHNGKDNGHQD